MPSKVSHAKGRDGCSRCKQRRVKCDKQTPSCANCHRRHESCTYHTWKQVMPRSTARKDTTEPPSIITKSIDFPAKHLSASSRISSVPLDLLFSSRPIPRNCTDPLDPLLASESQLWRHAVITNITKHPYLQSCLSSISNIYTSQHEPHSQHIDRSCAYQDQITASTSFRNAIFTVDESNWLAVLLFSIVMLMFQFSSQQACLGEYDYVETLQVLKMSAGIGASVAPFLRQSDMWVFIHYRDKFESRPMEAHVWSALCGLRRTVVSSVSHEKQEREVLRGTVQALVHWALICDAAPRTWKHYVIFPGLLSPEFFGLLASENDLALLILIYWCAVMRLGAKRWFLEQWLSRTAAMAQAELTEDWSHVLEWPNAVLSGRPTL